ncbi:MAG: hypothetical protein K1X51_18805 [Rhodospirillaceae bacterium]|nr:hypothetical protein [Rhodospirillaceae bacterium]
MTLFRHLLIALLLALQGITPLLHAHVRDQSGNGRGVHMVGLGDVGELATLPWSSLKNEEAPFVEPGEPYRRDHVRLPDAAGPRHPPHAGDVDTHAHGIPRDLSPRAGGTTVRLPAARAPPPASA